jgi:hypothetical protein
MSLNKPLSQKFFSRLRTHLLARVLGLDLDAVDLPEFTPEEQRQVKIIDNKIYAHKVMRVFYTTYDMRRDHSSINPRTHPDILISTFDTTTTPPSMVMWHARVIGIYHARVQKSSGGAPQKMHFLHVRWFAEDETQTRINRRLRRLGFYDVKQHPDEAFGFVDPAWVTRGTHIMPDFHRGQTELLHDRSIAGPAREWTWHYVGMFVFDSSLVSTDAHDVPGRFSDRDLHARYTGTFPGHMGQARAKGMTGTPTPWAEYPINKASATDEDAEVGTEDEDDAEIVPDGNEPPPEDENDHSEGEDEDDGEGGGGDEDDDNDEDDDELDNDGTGMEVVQGPVTVDDGETYNDDNKQYASL